MKKHTYTPCLQTTIITTTVISDAAPWRHRAVSRDVIGVNFFKSHISSHFGAQSAIEIMRYGLILKKAANLH